MPIEPREIRIRHSDDGFEIIDGEILETVISFVGLSRAWPFYLMKLPEEWEAEGRSRRARIQERLTMEGKTE